MYLRAINVEQKNSKEINTKCKRTKKPHIICDRSLSYRTKSYIELKVSYVTHTALTHIFYKLQVGYNCLGCRLLSEGPLRTLISKPATADMPQGITLVLFFCYIILHQLCLCGYSSHPKLSLMESCVKEEQIELVLIRLVITLRFF